MDLQITQTRTSIVMLLVIRIDALIAALVSNIGLPILELRFSFGLTYDLCDVIVSNLCFTSHLFSHADVGLHRPTLCN